MPNTTDSWKNDGGVEGGKVLEKKSRNVERGSARRKYCRQKNFEPLIGSPHVNRKRKEDHAKRGGRPKKPLEGKIYSLGEKALVLQETPHRRYMSPEPPGKEKRREKKLGCQKGKHTSEAQF